ncbi:MAG: rhomboid family intramembrane serine protease, partial [Paracoccus sp. (in: a-proteobacteria)]
LMTTSAAPMVGASGAVFGLAGAAILWQGCDRRAAGAPRWRAWGRAALLGAGLALANALMWLAAGGNLAWETHLGGALAGAAAAAILRRHERERAAP